MPIGVRSLAPIYPVVEITVDGTITDPLAIQAFWDGLALQHETGFHRVLVDAQHVRGHTPISVITDLAESVVAVDLPDGWKQALLQPLDPELMMQTRHWEALANNRGLTVRVFRDRAEAIAWLMAD
jgi:hypothetical protein